LSRLASIAVLLAAALLGAGCGERAEPVGTLPQSYPVSVHGAGDRSTMLEARPERIVALDPGSAEILLALGVGDRLVGVPTGLARDDAAQAQVVVRPTGVVNVSAVVALRPDLIVATPGVDELDVARAGRRSGAAVYVQPETSILNVERGTVDIGFLAGAAPEARELVGRIQRQVAAVEARLADVEPITVFVDTGFFITVPERSLLGDLVARAKGESVAGESPGPGPFSLAELGRLNPDVYLATSHSGVTLAALRRNPATRDLPAVKRGRLKIVSVKQVTWPGPHVADGLEAIARALHPNAFR
jgi:iron complex transport system substrate-binding protein